MGLHDGAHELADSTEEEERFRCSIMLREHGDGSDLARHRLVLPPALRYADEAKERKMTAGGKRSCWFNSTMNTALTRLLGIRVPLICSPMAGAAGGALAAAVAQGGAMGFIAGVRPRRPAAPTVLTTLQGHLGVEHLRTELAIARKALQLAPTDLLPCVSLSALARADWCSIGIGIILWRIESPAATPAHRAEFLAEISTARPKLLWLSFGEHIRTTVDEFRELDEQICSKLENQNGDQGGKERRIKVAVMVGTLEQAVEVATWGTVDILVAQGIEAGGHGTALALPLLSLLPSIQRAWSLLPPGPPLPLLVGAGGLATGSQLAAILPWAEGAVFGTTFLPTPECLYSLAQKELLIHPQTDGRATLRTSDFDYCRGTLGFPVGVNGRAIGNLTSVEGGNGKGWEESLRTKYASAVQEGDTERIVTWAGTSALFAD